MTNFEKVGLFMKTFGQEVKTNAGFPSDKINKLRINLIEEYIKSLPNIKNKVTLQGGGQLNTWAFYINAIQHYTTGDY